MRLFAVLIVLLAAAPAHAGVRLVDPFDPADYADRAAVGLLVPGAGPTVTREAALAALLRGKLEHGLLGGIAPGDELIEIGAGGGPEILVSLPPPGRSDNDRRYPIAVLGRSGLLTSESTRIEGLVSITDIATGRLRTVESADPDAALATLDDRIERNDRWRLPLTIALAVLLIVLARFRPQHALRALLVVLAANLWLSPVLALVTGVAVLLLPLGLACAADPDRVPRSRWASTPRPSRSRRSAPRSPGASTASTTCSRRCCSRRRSSAPRCSGAEESRSALVAFVDDRRQPLRRGRRRDRRARRRVRRAAAALLGLRPTLAARCRRGRGAVALALLLVGLDAASGGSSHVTSAIGDGPIALAGDIADRIELSVRRTAASLGATLVVLGSLAILAAVAAAGAPRRRARRVPRRPRRLGGRQRHARRRARRGRGDRDRACPRSPRAPILYGLASMRRAATFLALLALLVGRRRRLRRRGGRDRDTGDRRRHRRADDDRGGPCLDARGRCLQRREDLRVVGLRRLPHARGGRLVRHGRPESRRVEARPRARRSTGSRTAPARCRPSGAS